MRKNLHLTTNWALLIYVTAVIASITEGGIIPARAGDDPGDLLNYSFAVWVGSGVYQVKSADKRFAVLRAPFAYTLRHAHHDKATFRDKLGFRLLLPALVAIEDENDTNFTFGSAAFVRGLEVQIPVNNVVSFGCENWNRDFGLRAIQVKRMNHESILWKHIG